MQELGPRPRKAPVFAIICNFSAGNGVLAGALPQDITWFLQLGLTTQHSLPSKQHATAVFVGRPEPTPFQDHAHPKIHLCSRVDRSSSFECSLPILLEPAIFMAAPACGGHHLLGSAGSQRGCCLNKSPWHQTNGFQGKAPRCQHASQLNHFDIGH